MYSLSVFAKMKNLEFCYVTDHISDSLLSQPYGNLKYALENEMQLFISKERALFANSLLQNGDLLIPEGVSMPQAKFGFIEQAEQIESFALEKNLILDIFLPSGTGTSAAFLAQASKFNVFTTPCVGSEKYLQDQILAINSTLPIILTPPKKYHFGEIKPELYLIYKELKETTEIEFDLLYDPIGWLSMLSNIDKFSHDILYIHQGGIIGNESMLKRYQNKFPYLF